MKPFRRLAAAATLLLLALNSAAHAEQPGTVIIYDAPWAPGDAPRSGAAEFTVLLSVAQLRHQHTRAGIVAVGTNRGQLQPATEDALTRAALMGVAVVRLASSIQPTALPDDLFIEAGAQPALVAEKLLADCLVRFGPPPAAINPAQPTPKESAAIRRVIARYQLAFDAANSLRPSQSVALAMGPRNDYEN